MPEQPRPKDKVLNHHIHKAKPNPRDQLWVLLDKQQREKPETYDDLLTD